VLGVGGAHNCRGGIVRDRIYFYHC
jgi:hypothetical protein